MRRLRKECPETKVLVLTRYDEEENMIIAKEPGAYGFIPKKVASSDLIRGREALWCSSPVTNIIVLIRVLYRLKNPKITTATTTPRSPTINPELINPRALSLSR
jgi:DNA-binding NarL/FixJ family response regulator